VPREMGMRSWKRENKRCLMSGNQLPARRRAEKGALRFPSPSLAAEGSGSPGDGEGVGSSAQWSESFCVNEFIWGKNKKKLKG